jgi:hypothetical protein
MESSVEKRRWLFERGEASRSIRVTPRDLKLMENIARMRLASSDQLAALDGGSAQNVGRSLRALYDHGYVERPRAQIVTRLPWGDGSRPMVYGLTRQGARLLRSNGLQVRRRLLDGIDAERGAGWRFVEHTVAIADFWVALEVALRSRTDIRLLERGEILEDAPKTRRDREVRLEASIRLNGMLKKNAVIPDGLFGLRFSNDDESYFMLEIDRGEMPVERFKSQYRTYFTKKLLTYYEANRQRRHVHDLGIPHFRVAVVTTTPTRVEKMLQAVEEITQGRGTRLFLFTDQASLAHGNALEHLWLNGKREPVKLAG